MSPDEKISKVFYIIFLTLISIGLLFFAVIKIFGLKLDETLLQIIQPCIVRETLGIYCPGCGGIRSVIFLSEGDILNSLWYHPFVLYAVVMITLFIILYTMSLINKGRIKIPIVRGVYLYIGLGIIIVQWIVKLIMLLGFGIYPIPF